MAFSRAILTTGMFAAALLATATGAFADTGSNLIEKGKYLATAGDCISCHTRPGGEPFAGGLAISTPFGTVETPNITPDKDTGIGSYTDEQFYTTLHNGIAANGEYLYPVFPFTSFTKVTPDDIFAIKAYLFSLKPVHAPRKPNNLAFPFDIRSSLAVWRAIYFQPGVFKPDPNKSDQINRGAYLVQGLGHCGQCHTQRNILGALVKSDSLQGAAVEGWYAPNITSDWSHGIGSWSDEELFSYFKKGVAPGHGIAEGPMAEVVHRSLMHLSDEDLKAIVAYLKSTPAASLSASNAGTEIPLDKGAGALYVSYCASCHQLNGKGLPGKIPPLASNGSVTAEGPQDIVKVILGGLPATDTYGPMPSLAAYLNDAQIAAIANYVRTTWGNSAPTNADGYLVARIRNNTPIMLISGEGKTQCPDDLSPGARAVMDKANANAKNLLQSPASDTLVPRIEALVPKVKAAIPNASQADLVNGLTAAYCRQVAGQNNLSTVQKRNLLDIFSQLAYTQVATGTIAPPPDGKKASLR